jgi:hypothetical protein
MALASRAVADFGAFITLYGQSVVVTRNTPTLDSMGTVSAITAATFTITAMFQDISAKDWMIHDMGLAVSGNRKLYMKSDNSGNEVKEGDIVTDINSVQWRVIKIVKQPNVASTEVYKSCVVQSINLEGSG